MNDGRCIIFIISAGISGLSARFVKTPREY